jgi:hypothetical protein
MDNLRFEMNNLKSEMIYNFSIQVFILIIYFVCLTS